MLENLAAVMSGDLGNMALREKLVKIGAKVTPHSKYVTFQLAEVAVTRGLFAAILDRIERLALPPPDTHARMLA